MDQDGGMYRLFGPKGAQGSIDRKAGCSGSGL